MDERERELQRLRAVLGLAMAKRQRQAEEMALTEAEMRRLAFVRWLVRQGRMAS